MSTRWLVIVVAIVVAAVLAVVLVLNSGDGGEPGASPSPTVTVPTSPPATTQAPATSATPAPSPSASTLTATSFAASGDLVSGWYWLRDDAHVNDVTWTFTPLPATGDLVFALEVLATDAVDGARGQGARLHFAWGATAGDWTGRLPVTLPNVSTLDDPVGYTCRGTVTVPRATVGDATALTVRIGRNDVRGELEPVDMHVAVNAASVKLRVP